MSFGHSLLSAFIVFSCSSTSFAQQQTIDSGCGANLGSVQQSNITINIDCSSNGGRALSFNYSRLFGAMEVPLLMEIVPTGTFEDTEGDKSFKTFLAKNNGAPKEDQPEAHNRLVRFRNQYPYRNAAPLETPFWKAISGDLTASENIAWRATRGSKVDRICYLKSSVIDTSFYHNDILKDRPGSVAYCDRIFSFNNNRVGFTFLVVENVSSNAVEDVHFYFRENYSTNPIVEDQVTSDFGTKEYKERLDQEIDIGPSDGDALSNLIKKYGRARETEIALAEVPQSFLYLNRLEPKQKIIALLNIYVANKDNLPATYLYGIYDFEEASYTIRGAAFRVPIRRPSKDRAARVKVPFGWFLQ
jgi:hypothetical protein